MPSKPASKPAEQDAITLFRFKITIQYTSPPIWRRIVIPDCTLAKLHSYIQAAFDWENAHLHAFTIDGKQYGPSDHEMDGIDESTITLGKLLPKSKNSAKWLYEYDFGDDWRHQIVFEGHPKPDPKLTYPICLDGKQAGPLEDIGGPEGYADYVRELAAGEADEDDEDFDPAAFDADEVTKKLRKIR